MSDSSGDEKGTGAPKRRGGFKRLLDDLAHHRDRFRQFVGIAFVLVVALVGKPIESTFMPGVWLAVVGMLIRMWASGHVKKDKELATEGPYAFVRHPLYVGNLLIGFAFCLASGLWWSYPAWLAILLLFYPPAIRQEDGKLRGLFGEQWDAWRAKTLALIPTLPPAGPVAGNWSLRQSLVANGEPLYVAVFCLLLYYLWYQLG